MFKAGRVVEAFKRFQSEDAALKESMPPTRRRILESKKLRLMSHIIESEGYDDKMLASDLASGFSLIGEVPQSHVLPEKLLPATLSRNDLSSNAKRSNDALRYMTRSSGDDKLDRTLWEKDFAGGGKGLDEGPPRSGGTWTQ